jgi:hypothetical protein
MKKVKAPWVVFGGTRDELAHCTRCGAGLNLGGTPQPVPIALAASRAFIKIHEKCAETGRKEESPLIPSDWARGRDTGISSGTIYAVITGHASPCGWRDIPHDPSDFGRCYRLLELFPQWKQRLGLVAAAYPAWKPFVREWDKLTQMYEKAILTPKEPATEMYEFMQGLEKEALGG